MKLINLTPHEIVLIRGELEIRIPPSGIVARVQQVFEHAGTIITQDGVEIPVLRTRFGEIEGLPEPREGTMYIVSLLVAQAAPERDDLIVPNTSPQGAVRNEKGEIVGVKSFIKL